jgi:hypothetical protein
MTVLVLGRLRGERIRPVSGEPTLDLGDSRTNIGT